MTLKPGLPLSHETLHNLSGGLEQSRRESQSRNLRKIKEAKRTAMRKGAALNTLGTTLRLRWEASHFEVGGSLIANDDPCLVC
jgi:hypothetical protein